VLVGIGGSILFTVGDMFDDGWELKGNATLLLSSPLFGILDCAVAVTVS
jgi:hypothetical protein